MKKFVEKIANIHSDMYKHDKRCFHPIYNRWLYWLLTLKQLPFTRRSGQTYQYCAYAALRLLEIDLNILVNNEKEIDQHFMTLHKILNEVGVKIRQTGVRSFVTSEHTMFYICSKLEQTKGTKRALFVIR